MQSAQDQMTCKRRLDGNLGSFNIANFSYHNDIRVLPENVAKTIGKGKIYLGLYLHLSNAGQLILNGVLHGEYVSFFAIKLVDGCVESGGLAAAGRTGEQDYAMWNFNKITEAVEHLRAKAYVIQSKFASALIEQSEDNSFSAGGGNYGNANIG